jgi:hypothetical protein
MDHTAQNIATTTRFFIQDFFSKHTYNQNGFSQKKSSD